MNKPKKEHGALLALHGCGGFAQRMADIAVTWAKDVNETTAFTNFDRITSNSLTVTPIWQQNIENSLGSATHEEASKSAHLRNHFAKKKQWPENLLTELANADDLATKGAHLRGWGRCQAENKTHKCCLRRYLRLAQTLLEHFAPPAVWKTDVF